MEWLKKLLVYTSSAAGLAALLYYLLREEAELTRTASTVEGERDEKKLRPEDVTKEQVQRILNEIVESQEMVRAEMKQLTKELLEHPMMTFDQVYHRLSVLKPQDPLERFGLSTHEFDELLTPHHKDPQIMDGLARIMAPAGPTDGTLSQGTSVSMRRVVEVHEAMLEELRKLVLLVSSTRDKERLNPKTVTLAAQAVVSAKVEEKFNLTSDDIEVAVIQNQQQLAKDQDFLYVNQRLQETMGELMGVHGG